MDFNFVCPACREHHNDPGMPHLGSRVVCVTCHLVNERDAFLAAIIVVDVNEPDVAGVAA